MELIKNAYKQPLQVIPAALVLKSPVTKKTPNILLEQAEVPVPKGDIVRTERGMKEAIDYIGYPIVVKPIDGNHGRGITANIDNWEDAVIAFEAAKEVSRSVIIVENIITGLDYRLLVINYKLVAAALRTPAHVIGDGKSTIQELIDKVNEDPRRGYGHEKVLTMIKVNEMTEAILEMKGYTIETILPEGEFLKLKDTANLSTGGTATDVTDIVHPSNIFMAERIAKIIGLDICGIDVMTSDISVPLEETGWSRFGSECRAGFSNAPGSN